MQTSSNILVDRCTLQIWKSFSVRLFTYTRTRTHTYAHTPTRTYTHHSSTLIYRLLSTPPSLFLSISVFLSFSPIFFGLSFSLFEQKWRSGIAAGTHTHTVTAYGRRASKRSTANQIKQRTYVRTHSRTHARTHACTHARTHTHTHTRTHTQTHGKICTHTTHTHARTHERTHARTHAHANSRENMYTHYVNYADELVQELCTLHKWTWTRNQKRIRLKTDWSEYWLN